MRHTLRLLATLITSTMLCACITSGGGGSSSDAGHDSTTSDAGGLHEDCNEAGVCRDMFETDAFIADSEVEVCDEAGVCLDEGVDDCNEAGVCDDWGAAEDWGESLTFPQVIITDTTSAANENMAGSPGVDICSVISTCGTAIAATLNPGFGDICETAGPDCQTNRANPAAALVFENPCEAASDPSHYVVLGMGGQLTIEFDTDQAGCTVTIVELEGSDPELYSVQACTDADLTNCLVGENGSTEFAQDLIGTEAVRVPNLIE